MEETDITYELDEMLKNTGNECNYSQAEQYHEENMTQTTQQTDLMDSDTDTASIIMSVQKKKETRINPSVTPTTHITDIHDPVRDEIIKLRKEFGSLKDDMRKMVNVMTQLTGEIDGIKHRVEKLELESEGDDEYKEYIDRILSVNLDKIKMKLKKSLKKSLLNQ